MFRVRAAPLIASSCHGPVVGSGRGIPDYGEAMNSRHCFFAQFQPLARQPRMIEKAPCDVAPRLGKTAGEFRRHGVTFEIERHDRDCPGRSRRGSDASGAAHKDDVDLSPDEIAD